TNYTFDFYYTARAQAIRTVMEAWKPATSGGTDLYRYPVVTTGAPTETFTSNGYSRTLNKIYAQYYEHKTSSATITRRHRLILNLGKSGSPVNLHSKLDGNDVSPSSLQQTLTDANLADSNWNTASQYVQDPVTCAPTQSTNNIYLPGSSVM